MKDTTLPESWILTGEANVTKITQKTAENDCSVITFPEITSV